MVPAAAFPHWHPHLDVWVLVVGLAVGYGLVLRRLGPRLAPPGRPAASRTQVALFVLALLVLWAAADWPVHDVAEGYLYSVHMVQHLLLSLVFPPLLLLATPAWVARWVLSPRLVGGLVRRLARPVPAFLLFNGFVILTHFPEVVEASVRSEPAHLGLHVALVTTALLMWMPVLSPLPEIPRLSPPLQMLYLFFQSILPTVPAAWLTWADEPLYRVYAEMPKLFGLSAADDQRAAGMIMKIAGGAILWGFITAVFFRWALREEKADRALLWSDVEAELQRLGPGPAE